MNTKINKKIFELSPLVLQNLLITGYNLKMNLIRYSGEYKKFKKYFNVNNEKNIDELRTIQEKKLNEFLKYVNKNSTYYSKLIPNKTIYTLNDLKSLPISNKKDLVENYSEIKTIDEKEGVVSLTGGTTGASLKVVYTKQNIQERHAFLDYFRESHGYKRGKKTAWFSGKHIVDNNATKNFSRIDYINNIRYFSTFHINNNNINEYISEINKFKPEFIVGFPSSVFEIANLAINNNLKFNGKVKMFFPTAESLNYEEAKVIQQFFSCEIKDQYASSEGAPFITECEFGKLHYQMLTGVIEVVNDNLEPSTEGEILVTSFQTMGTPLIRYRIGDSILLSDEKGCPCGQENPIVKKIIGRTNDFVLTPFNGKVNLGNISNCTKNINGIIQFQIIQNSKEKIICLIQANSQFDETQFQNFQKNLNYTIGKGIEIDYKRVSDIPREKSGKFKIVKNNLQ